MSTKMRVVCSIMLMVMFTFPLTCFAAYDRGLVNEPFNFDGFFARYDYNEYIAENGFASTSYTDGWTNAQFLCTAQWYDYRIVNCNEYVNARAEADSTSKSLQKFYLGSTVCVVGFWRDWALCICDEYNEQNFVCGWVKQMYLQPASDSAYDNYDKNSSSDGGYYEEEAPIYIGECYVVNCNEWVSLREGPYTSASRLAKVPLGARVDNCYDAENGFYYCEYNGSAGFILSQYLSSNPQTPAKPSTKTSPSKDDSRYDLDQYTYLPVVEKGRGALVFQKSPRGSFMKKHKFYDGDYVYVNVNWRQDGYAIAYEDGDYGYVDASYIDW